MNFDPALDGLLDLLAEATVRALDTRNPAGLAGIRNEVPTAKGSGTDDKIHPQTESLQTTTS